MDKLKQNPVFHAVLLGLFSLAAAALLAFGNLATHDEIIQRRKEDLQRSLAMVIPDALHDNDPLDDRLSFRLKNGETRLIYRARKGGETTAVAFTMTVHGYGLIEMIMGVDSSGRVLGVRILKHEETPGLGDQIEAAKSDWIKGFDGLSLQNTPAKQWNVKKDGGRFDQFSGATISPRAVVRGVHQGLKFFEQNRNKLLHGKADAQKPGEDEGAAPVHDAALVHDAKSRERRNA